MDLLLDVLILKSFQEFQERVNIFQTNIKSCFVMSEIDTRRRILFGIGLLSLLSSQVLGLLRPITGVTKHNLFKSLRKFFLLILRFIFLLIPNRVHLWKLKNRRNLMRNLFRNFLIKRHGNNLSFPNTKFC